ncbi:MAG TPA: ACT domain-containing protein [Streptosporangiaceae bacterium]|nr:ACT domain-containing protein [Streptosporangiaceae bacterium]
MTLYKLRVDLPDNPGGLAALATALAEHDVNILSLAVHGKDASTVTDDLVVDMRDVTALGSLICALHEISPQISITRTDPYSLVDAPARALDIAARLAKHPDQLGKAVARLLGAEEASQVVGAAPGEPPPHRLTVGVPGSGRVSVWRRWAPFTVTEHARAQALARLAGELRGAAARQGPAPRAEARGRPRPDAQDPVGPRPDAQDRPRADPQDRRYQLDPEIADPQVAPQSKRPRET